MSCFRYLAMSLTLWIQPQIEATNHERNHDEHPGTIPTSGHP